MEENLYNTVMLGVALLDQEYGYTQNTIVAKSTTLTYVFSSPSLSNILKRKTVGLPLLKTAAKGISEVVRRELGMQYDPAQKKYIALSGPWERYIVPEKPEQPLKSTYPVLHLDGRLPVPEKTAFIKEAQKEVIEFGVRLRTFAEYFTSSNEKVYKAYIIKLLEKGVNVKCYLLDPDSNEASLYFRDRIRAMPDEKDAIEEMKKAVERLKVVIAEFEKQNYRGKFEVFKYKHIPYNLFLAVDPDTPGGKMLISHYIYGIRRAETPVMEIERQYQPDLYKKYRESLRLLMKDAIKIVPDKP